MVGKWLPALFLSAWAASMSPAGAAAPPEYNPLPTSPVSIGPEAQRLIVGFRSAADRAAVTLRIRRQSSMVESRQASTGPADVAGLARRARLELARSRQLTPSMHVLYLPQTLYGAKALRALEALRADPAVEFAEVDQRRYPHTLPDDPLLAPTAGAAGQWYLQSPNATTPTADAAATDTVSAWTLTTGGSGIVIADIDTGVRFDHPDLLRAGFGGRLLPGYDFVAEDVNPTTGAALGTYSIANDGDGWDPDPSDPGDWINGGDQSNTTLFPATSCPIADSTWHGTRVMGLLGAITNNAVGIAGMTWSDYVLPVRALGKCGGYDSDIIAAMQWAAGMPVDGVPANPYPADIINLSLGGSGGCPAAYSNVVATLTGLGVLIVASAGNASGPVDAPANCPGVLAVAGLRNVGTKVGYSSFGSEVGISAPAGNCVNSSGPCLKPIDTTTNTGLTIPATNTYTTETNPNLGTSFSAPLVSGIAALMRAVNGNLTPAQLMARIQASALAFPQPAGLPVCPAVATDGSQECACPNDGSQCGAGMVNAFNAVTAALRPIAAVTIPAGTAVGRSAVLDAAGSAAACGRSIVSYAWAATGGVTLDPGTASSGQATVTPSGAPGSMASSQVTVTPNGAPGSIVLTVTDSSGAVDSAVIAVSAAGMLTAPAITPATAGTAATACPAALTVAPAAPTVSESFTPASVGENVASTLTVTLNNSNGFALTQANLTDVLPAGLVLSTTAGAAAATTCSGGGSLTTTGGITLAGAVIPAAGSCTITLSVQSATPGTYTNAVAAHALTTAPAGANSDAATATLTVTAPTKSGGGALDWWDSLFVVGVLLAGRRHGRRPRE